MIAAAATGGILGAFKFQVQQRIIRMILKMAKDSHGKDGKQRAFSTFPRLGCGYVFEFVRKYLLHLDFERGLSLPGKQKWKSRAK